MKRLMVVISLLVSGCYTRAVDRELVVQSKQYCTSEMSVDLCIQEIRRAREWTYWGGRGR